jgi:heme-degrading monooxygenase HmoA
MHKTDGSVIGLFFEVTPKPGHLDHYFTYVEKLKSELSKQKGLLWLQRYHALLDNNSLLSHQLWDHQDSIVAWRQNEAHRSAQTAGIKTHFQNYRIRIGERLRHGSIDELALGKQAESLNGKLLLSIHSNVFLPKAAFDDCGLIPSVFSTIIDPHNIITLSTIDDMAKAVFLTKTLDKSVIDKAELFLINRNYSMFDRDQAPRHDSLE